jgi:ribosomal protein S18 acetylase RimI-like enzyme
LYVQEEVGRILWAISMKIDNLSQQAHIWYLHTLPKGRWLGSDLLQSAIKELKERNITSVNLLCRMNLRAYPFYQKHGFEDVTERARKIRRMKKEL